MLDVQALPKWEFFRAYALCILIVYLFASVYLFAVRIWKKINHAPAQKRN